jgi:hypothetical protein
MCRRGFPPSPCQRIGGIPRIRFQRGAPTPRFIEEWRLEDPVIAVQSTCRSFLVVIDIGGSQYIQFSHLSVKEFLTSSRLAEANQKFPVIMYL